jgi:hypothetical protein
MWAQSFSNLRQARPTIYGTTNGMEEIAMIRISQKHRRKGAAIRDGTVDARAQIMSLAATYASTSHVASVTKGKTATTRTDCQGPTTSTNRQSTALDATYLLIIERIWEVLAHSHDRTGLYTSDTYTSLMMLRKWSRVILQGLVQLNAVKC